MTKRFSELFARDKHRCVYCGRDLLVDFESFMLAQEDHLVPSAKEGGNDLANLVVACYVCNKLKGHFKPDFLLTATNRTKYIDAIRDRIMQGRSHNMRAYASWTHEEPGASPPVP